MMYLHKRPPVIAHNAKTTLEQREEIRREYAQMQRKSYAKLGAKHGLSTSTVQFIIKNIWRDMR